MKPMERAAWLLDTYGYEQVAVTPQNFTKYSNFVLELLADRGQATLKKYEAQGWLTPFVDDWRKLQDNFEDARRKDPLMAYVPAHSVAQEFHESSAKMRYWRGGNRTSKTFSGYIEAAMFATGEHKFNRIIPAWPCGVLILAGQALKDYAPKVFELKMLFGEPGNDFGPLFPEDGKWFKHHDSRKHILTLGCPPCAEAGKAQTCPGHHQKSKIYLVGQEQGLEALEAFQVGLLAIDEYVPEKYYQAAKQRIASVQDSAMIMTATPLQGPEAWPEENLVRAATKKVLYDPTNEDSPLAVSLHEIDQFAAGLVPEAEIRNNMRDYDPFEIEARVYGRPAAFTDSPVFDRDALAAMRDSVVSEPTMGQLELRGMTIEELLLTRELEFIPTSEWNATTSNDSGKDIYNGVRIWEYPEKGQEYVVGADVAVGLAGKDRSSATVLKVTRDDTGQYVFTKVAEFYGLLNIIEYAHEIKKVAIYYQSALVVVERTGIGLGVLESLRRQLFYGNLFRDATPPDQFKTAPGPVYGLDTNVKTKPKMVGLTQKALKDSRLIINDVNTITECVSFAQERTDTGLNTRYRGAQGTRDDRVMSICLAVYAAEVSQSEFFSMPPEHNDLDVDSIADSMYNRAQDINDLLDGNAW